MPPEECPPVGACYPVIVTGVRDGDTLNVTILVEFGLRLKDINAPERSTDEGLEAKEYLENLVEAGSDFKVFIPHGTSSILKSLSFDRLVGYLFDGEGRNVGDMLVAAGMAEALKNER